MAFRWWAYGGQTLNAGLVAVIFQGIRTCIAIKPYIFLIFQEGPDPCPPPPFGSAHKIELERGNGHHAKWKMSRGM